MKMRQITKRIIIAFIGGALLWEGIRGGVSGNVHEWLLVLVGGALVYKSRFWE